MSMTRLCVISLCLLFHIVIFFKLHLYLKKVLVILLLLQLTPTGVTTYPIDGSHCNAFLKYLNRYFSHKALKIINLFF